MSTYISLISLTQKGIDNIKDGPARLDNAKAVFKAMGAELKEFYLVTGRYDIVVISEAPDDETVAKIASGYWFGWGDTYGDSPGIYGRRI